MMWLMLSGRTKSMMRMLFLRLSCSSHLRTGSRHLSAHWDLTEDSGWKETVLQLGVRTPCDTNREGRCLLWCWARWTLRLSRRSETLMVLGQGLGHRERGQRKGCEPPAAG